MADLSLTPIAECLTADVVFEALTGMVTDGVFWLDGGDSRPSYVGVGDRVELDPPVLPGLRRASERMRDADSMLLGLVGWLSYDLGTDTVGVDLGRVDGMHTSFIEVREALAIDPDGTVSLITRQLSPQERQDRIHVLRSQLRRPHVTVPESTVTDIRWHDTDGEYAAKILRCQDRIRAGDAYQLCLTTRVTVHGQPDPLSVYRRLRRTNGTNRSGIIRIGDTWMLSTSPEQFLAVDEQRVVSTSPIKGTRPRSDDPVEDERLRTELREDVKERAENIMIVDLMRNDLSRVCATGTITVTRLLEVESHPQVHQLFSTIQGRLREDNDTIDALAACFPAGSMTGAPKRRAMELLEDIECGPRGLYAGAFGYVRFDGVSDFAMTIRTIVCTPDKATIGTGGGITALSVPDEEVEEIHLKARALLAALSNLPTNPDAGSARTHPLAFTPPTPYEEVIVSPPSSSDVSNTSESEIAPQPGRSSPSAESGIDRDRVEFATRELLLALGENPERLGLQETPRRIAESWRDFYSGGHATIRALPDQTQAGDDLVLIRNIDFVSVCEHHLLPFSGLVHIAYQPRDILLGLSDIPRLVRRASSRLHLQEGLTQEIADQLREETDAHGVVVVVEARHGCVSDRGIRQARVRAVTTATRGTLDSPSDSISLMAVLTGGSATVAPEQGADASYPGSQRDPPVQTYSRSDDNRV